MMFHYNLQRLPRSLTFPMLSYNVLSSAYVDGSYYASYQVIPVVRKRRFTLGLSPS